MSANTFLFSVLVGTDQQLIIKQLIEALLLDTEKKTTTVLVKLQLAKNWFSFFHHPPPPPTPPPHLDITSNVANFPLFLKLSTSPDRPTASSAVAHCPAGPFCNRSKSSNKAKFFFKPQTPESPIFEEKLKKQRRRKPSSKYRHEKFHKPQMRF